MVKRCILRRAEQIWEEDCGVLGLQLQKHLEPVRLRMLLNQFVRRLGSTDEGQSVNLTSLHQRRHCSPSRATDEVDSAMRQSLCKCVHGEGMYQTTNGGNLHYHHIAHEQRGDERCVGLVQGVIVRSQAHDDPNSRPTDKGPSRTDVLPLVIVFGGIGHADGGNDLTNEHHGPIELGLGILAILANLPHEDGDDGLAVLGKFAHKVLDGLDSTPEAHLRPLARPTVPRLAGCVQYLQRLIGGELWRLTDDDGLQCLARLGTGIAIGICIGVIAAAQGTAAEYVHHLLYLHPSLYLLRPIGRSIGLDDISIYKRLSRNKGGTR
mmetsp:Transcript_2712/g.7961  ORF Transcript_2712/g.7961 Transcript_2712/m.7961 type:complete len:322 (+) Transcript_2712:974-1939(+)